MPLSGFSNVTTADDLSADIKAIDLDSQAGAGSGTVYTITLASGATLLESADLAAIDLNGSDRLVIDGGASGATLDGGSLYRGFFVYQGDVTIANLTIANAVARGGAGGVGGGGGGAGLGGGLFVANDPANNALPAAVTLTNVSFVGDKAIGGDGGGSTNGTQLGGGGGGGMGGAGGQGPESFVGGGGGGIGTAAAGGNKGMNGSAGTVFGASGGGSAPKAGFTGGSSGGGGSGGGYYAANAENASAGGGIGGLDGGADATNIPTGGAGGFGGGGGGGQYGGNGGFGGGGGDGGLGIGGNGGNGGFGGGGGSGGNGHGLGGFGAGDAGFGGYAGGGGLGAGGGAFVQSGASLTITGGKTSGGSVVGGNPGDTTHSAQGGSGLGAGLFLQGNQSITFGAGANPGEVTEFDDVIADQNDATDMGRVVVDGAGTVRFKGLNTYAGGTTIRGGTLDLEAIGAGNGAGSGAITFASSAIGTLALGPAAFATPGSEGAFANAIGGFAASDTIDLRGLQYIAGETKATLSGSTLTVTNGTTTDTLTLTSPAGMTFTTRSDGARGTDVSLVCFVSGTRIRTTRGEVPVEVLAIGDLVVTASGAARPIRWIGHRTLDCSRHPRRDEIRPVRIAAHAFGEGRPARDLLVSEGHAICLDVSGEVLVPAGALVDGTTITRAESATVTYWHVELDSHDILLAENMPAESYLDMGNRGFFIEAGTVGLGAVPDAPRTHGDFCRPFHAGGPLVAAVRCMVERRARRRRCGGEVRASDAAAERAATR